LNPDPIRIRIRFHNTDLQECTVYVENLPPDTTHESVKAKYLEFGPVAYVSIPKFRNSRRIKAGLEKTRV
jgi:RNA recognition motif-containing protein